MRCQRMSRRIEQPYVGERRWPGYRKPRQDAATKMIAKKKAARSRAAKMRRCRLGDDRFALLVLGLFRSPRLDRKLQYGCLLAFT
jgi:hypothetical protein